jgi:hypothetical protein
MVTNYADPNDKIYTDNPNWMRPGETQQTWNTRIGYNPSTGMVNQTDPVKLPEIGQMNFDISTAQGQSAYYKQFIQDQEAQAEKARQEKITAQKEQEALRAQQTSIVDKIKGIGAKRTEGLSELGFEPTQIFAQQKAQLAEVDSLYTDYNATVARRDQQIAGIQGAGGGTDFQSNAVAQINRNANVLLGQKSSNINSKLAIMEAQNNNWESAQKFVNQAIVDYTAGLTADYDMLSSFIKDNNDLIDSLGKDYKDALNQRQALILDQISQAKADKQQEIENNFKQQGLDLQMMQENRLGAGDGTGVVAGENYYDAGLESLLEENPGLSAGQLATLYVTNSGENLTDKEKQNILARAQVVMSKPKQEIPVVEAPPTETPTLTPKEKGQQAGAGVIDMLKLPQFRQDQEKYKKKQAEGQARREALTGFFSGIYNSLFGK